MSAVSERSRREVATDFIREGIGGPEHGSSPQEE